MYQNVHRHIYQTNTTALITYFLQNRYLNLWKPYQKEILKKSHISHKVSQESHVILYSQSHKLEKEGHIKFHNHTLVKQKSMEQ